MSNLTSIQSSERDASQKILLRVRRASTAPPQKAAPAGQQVAPAEQPEATAVNPKRITGFGPMSRVTTSFGEVHAHVLRKGDMVRTTLGHFKRIEHVDCIRFDEEFVRRHPGVLPIKLRKGALGQGMPKVDMMLAPYQKVRVGRARSAMPMVDAIKLLDRPFVERATENQITYTIIRLDGPAEILCEGCATSLET